MPDSPNVVKVMDCFEDDGYFYTVRAHRWKGRGKHAQRSGLAAQTVPVQSESCSQLLAPPCGALPGWQVLESLQGGDLFDFFRLLVSAGAGVPRTGALARSSGDLGARVFYCIGRIDFAKGQWTSRIVEQYHFE